MKVGVFYATREGQTQRIAEHIEQSLLHMGFEVDLKNVAENDADPQLEHYAGIILAASVHVGRHEREMVDFVTRHRVELLRHPTAFLSVSMSEAAAENHDVPTEQRVHAAADAQRAVQHFCEKTGWEPSASTCVAGALRYSQYSPLIKLIMRAIAKREGGSTDTRRDHELTNWPNLDAFVHEFLSGLSAPVHA